MRFESPYRPPTGSRPIFLVDDNDDDRMLFCRLLQQSQIANPCRVFGHGEDAIDALIAVLRGGPVPLTCFLDVRMPGMNGFDVLRWIRCQHPLDEMPVVMLSSSDEARDLHEANCSGAQCYLSKFPSATELAAIVHEAERAAINAPGGAFKLPCNLLYEAPNVIGRA